MKKILFILAFLLTSSCSTHRNYSKDRIDQNKDGIITRLEYDNYHNMRFEMMDKNNNGMIDKSESASKSEIKKKKGYRHTASECLDAKCQLHTREKN